MDDIIKHTEVSKIQHIQWEVLDLCPRKNNLSEGLKSYDVGLLLSTDIGGLCLPRYFGSYLHELTKSRTI